MYNHTEASPLQQEAQGDSVKGSRFVLLVAAGICCFVAVVSYIAVQRSVPEPPTQVTTALPPIKLPDSAPGFSLNIPDRTVRRTGSPADYDGARTPEDVAWLQRNGYPTRRMIESALARSGQGATLTVSGTSDPVAALDAEQIALSDPSRQSEALQTLSRHAQAGSVYALETMSRVFQDGANPDPIRAKAFMKAAELRGNWAAGLTPLKHQLTPEQEMYAAVMAHQIIGNLSISRERMRLPPLSVDTRPGLEELIMEIDEMHRAMDN